MLFRRLVDDLRAQQWLAVAIDLLIVVVGVFIGIEAANWNERRQDRQEERSYYARIIADLETDLNALAAARRFADDNDKAAEFVLASLTDDAVAQRQPGRFAWALTYAGYLYFPLPSRTTYDELVSTGNLRQLRDPELKLAISRYYAGADEIRQWDSMIRLQQSEYWTQVAGLLPRHALRDVMARRDVQLSPAETTSILARARARPALADRLAAMTGHQEWIRQDSERLSGETRKLQDRLRRHLAELD